MLKEALNRVPEDAEAALSLSRVLTRMGENEEADAALRVGAQRGKGTFWGLLCNDELDR